MPNRTRRRTSVSLPHSPLDPASYSRSNPRDSGSSGTSEATQSGNRCKICYQTTLHGAVYTFNTPDGRTDILHQRCYDTAGPFLYKWGIIQIAASWAVPMATTPVCMFVLFYDLVRVAEILRGRLMEFEIGACIVLPIGFGWFLFKTIWEGEMPRCAPPSTLFLSVVVSFRSICGVQPAETNWLLIAVWNFACFILFCSAGPCPPIICTCARLAFKLLTTIDIWELMHEAVAESNPDCQDLKIASSPTQPCNLQTIASPLEEQEQCCICLWRDAALVGMSCTHAPVVCEACHRCLVFEKLKSCGRASQVPPCQDLSLRQLQHTIVACPICRNEGTMKTCASSPAQ